MNEIQETLEYILKSIIKDNDQVNVESKIENDINVLDISAPQEIIGQIIGKNGKIIKSIRSILNISYPNHKISVNVKDQMA